jgi:hypothetical protein
MPHNAPLSGVWHGTKVRNPKWHNREAAKSAKEDAKRIGHGRNGGCTRIIHKKKFHAENGSRGGRNPKWHNREAAKCAKQDAKRIGHGCTRFIRLRSIVTHHSSITMIFHLSRITRQSPCFPNVPNVSSFFIFRLKPRFRRNNEDFCQFQYPILSH